MGARLHDHGLAPRRHMRDGWAQGIAGGVVDERLRVYGVRRLRVCDASVMPLMISAHLQATVYAIGEKGAAMMLEDWAMGMRNGSCRYS